MRARYARLRSGNAGWWAKHFEAVQSEFDQSLCLLIALTWAKTSTIIELEDSVSSAVASLDSKAWQRIFEEVQRSHRLTRQAIDQAEPSELELITSETNQRFACLLMTRTGSDGAHEIFRRRLTGESLEDPIIRRFAYTEALDLRSFGSNTWKPDLAQIQQCHIAGESFEPYEARQATRTEDWSMPAEIAIEISKKATLYPSFLVAAAQERLRSDVKSHVVPVAQTAQDEGWFSCD
jgi:hypothetical protein